MAVPTSVAVQDFLDYLKFEKRYSAHTIRSYQDDLHQFFGFIEPLYGQLLLAHISSEIVRSWLASLKERKLSSKSINRKISSLRSFFKYCLRIELIDKTVMASVISQKANKRLPAYVEEKDTHTLLHTIEFPDTWKGQTDQLAIHILYNTGLRLFELINLKESQI